MTKIVLLEDALEAAVARHFGTLFEVLLVDPSPQGLQRFQAGLKKLSDTERSVATIIEKMEDTQ